MAALDGITADTVDVIITGTASSPHGKRYVDLHAVVATLSVGDDGSRWLKVWPEVETPEDGGKIWFPESGIERIQVV